MGKICISRWKLYIGKKLYSEHRMLCERHFKETDCTDAMVTKCSYQGQLSHVTLNMSCLCFGQPGPSQTRDLGERSNVIEVSQVQHTETTSTKPTERDKKKCTAQNMPAAKPSEKNEI